MFFFASIAEARDVTFTWTANTETIDGYRLYYKTGTSGAPYDGTGAIEGNSPIDTGNVTNPPAAQNGEFRVSEDSTASGQLQAQDREGGSLTYSVVTELTSQMLVYREQTALLSRSAMERRHQIRPRSPLQSARSTMLLLHKMDH